MESRKKPIRGRLTLGWIALLAVVCLGITACDSNQLDTPEEDALASLQSIERIESMEMTPIPVQEEGAEQEYVLRVTMKKSADIQFPDVINLLGMSKNMPSSLIYDDGTGYDAIAGDLVFTGVVTDACTPFDLPEGVAAKDVFSITIKCSGDFILPGEECEGEGICPETASRSFLWGLIEYDTSVAVCWCGFACEYDIQLKLGM